MKKIIFGFSAMLALSALASCTSASAISTQAPEKGTKRCEEMNYQQRAAAMYCRLETGDNTVRDENGNGKIDQKDRDNHNKGRGGLFR